MGLRLPVSDVEYTFRFRNKEKGTVQNCRLQFDREEENGRLRFFNVETGGTFTMSKARVSYIFTHNLISKRAIESPKNAEVKNDVDLLDLIEQSQKKTPEEEKEESDEFLKSAIAKLGKIPQDYYDVYLRKFDVDVKELIEGLYGLIGAEDNEENNKLFGKYMTLYMRLPAGL